MHSTVELSLQTTLFDGRIHTLIVKHDMGLKASVFYAEAVKAAFSHLGFGTDIFVTDDQVIAISPPDPAHPLNRSYEGARDLKYPSSATSRPVQIPRRGSGDVERDDDDSGRQSKHSNKAATGARLAKEEHEVLA